MTWAPDYIEMEAARKFLRLTDTDDDSELTVWITASSRAIDDHCNRQFGKIAAPEQRTYSPYWDDERGAWMVEIDDVTDTTGFTATVGGAVIDAYAFEPKNAVGKGKAYTHLRILSTSTGQPTCADDDVLITLAWGWTSMPGQVGSAVRLQLNRLNSRRNAPFGVAGSPSEGSEVRLLSKLDPDVAVSLKGLRRPRKTG